MKKTAFILSAVLIVGLALVALARVNSFGGKLTASTTTAQVTGISADWISIAVDASAGGDVFVKVDCTTNAFNTALAAGTVTAVAPGNSHVWPAGPKTVITNFCYATTNSTALFRWSGAQAITLE